MREGVIVILENIEGQIAMQQRDDARWYKRWGLFGGWLENNETPEAGALREIREELSVQLNPEKLIFITICYPLEDVRAYIYHYDVVDELANAVLGEGLDWRFMRLDELNPENIVTHQLDILKSIYKLS